MKALEAKGLALGASGQDEAAPAASVSPENGNSAAITIAVLCEGDGSAAAELLGKARQLTPSGRVLALSETEEPPLSAFASFGADEAAALGRLTDDCAQADRIADALRQLQPDAVLFPATIRGRFLSAWAAAKLHTGLTADCTALSLTETGLLKQVRPAFGGNLTAEILCKTARPQMASVRPGVFPEPATLTGRTCALRPLKLAASPERLEQLAFTPAESGVSLQGAPVIVTGGKGVGSKKGFEKLEELAALLGGGVGATRSAVDAGWIGYPHQIGQTGVTVRPRLYLAFGVSGLVQHTVGMSSSSVVVAVNTERNAPHLCLRGLWHRRRLGRNHRRMDTICERKEAASMNYKKTYTPKNGYTPLCEIGKCSLKDLEFGILELSDGQSYTYETKDREVAFIILGGKANFTANGKDYGMVGARRNVFENPKAECFYAPRNCSVKIDSPWNIKIAVCSTPIDVDSEPQAIHQADVRVVRLGVKPWERDTSFIVDGSTNAKKLTIGEAYITPGNWAGFPPHKHDVDNMPSEGVLEEIYYFLFDPQQGFGVQCLYTSDGEIDEAYRVKNDELVEFPRGYHTTVGAPGYNTYFLWLMAGKDQGFYRSNDPDHEWVSAVENLVKKQ